MSEQELTDVILAGLHERGPTFGARLLALFLRGVEPASRRIDPEAAQTARIAADILAAGADLTADVERRLG